eukprot:TRINITY_DN60367_c0_g1_i1.p1 TRINITY_DN60367_c0_g1~~TRINITY_DN60367_c0_g1_i1.p1  ORF type:complete len:109 (-),score=7.75 TRINITY_DN60367_c0_g1_i1:35-361(-)
MFKYDTTQHWFCSQSSFFSFFVCAAYILGRTHARTHAHTHCMPAQHHAAFPATSVHTMMHMNESTHSHAQEETHTHAHAHTLIHNVNFCSIFFFHLKGGIKKYINKPE